MEDAISLGTASPLRPRLSRVDWEFSLDAGGVDPVLGIQYISEVYQNADPGYANIKDNRHRRPSITIEKVHII